VSDSMVIENSYWVLRGKLLAGEYPASQDVHATKAKIRWLLEQGITLCLDLTEESEPGGNPYAPLLLEEAKRLGRPAAHLRLAIPDYAVPTRDEMARVLDTLDLALRAGQSVYLHCYGGIGRTGTVVGCYLARHGISGTEAVEHISRLRAGIPASWMQSPETPEQMEMIMKWKPGT
jgi:protein-tyrosine phosphatase